MPRLSANKPHFAKIMSLVLLGVMCHPSVKASPLYLGGPVPVLMTRPTVKVNYFYVANENSAQTPYTISSANSDSQRLALTFKTRGFVYHPALLTWQAMLRPEVSTINASQGSTRDTRRFNYSIDTSWLQLKPYKIGLRSARNTVEVSTNLQGTSEVKSENDLATLAFDFLKAPIVLQIGSAKSETDDYFNSTRSSKFRSFSIDKNTSRSRTSLRVEDKNDVSNSDLAGSSTDILLARFENDWSINEDFRLSDRLSYRRSDYGSRQAESTNGSVNITLSHPMAFKSNWSASAAITEASGQKYKTYGVYAGLSHQLYDNLSTNLIIGTTNSSHATGEASTNSYGISSSYTRPIPWGRIRAGVSRRESIGRDKRPSVFIDVIGETLFFEGSTTSGVLENFNIDPDSILITDELGTTIYIAGYDYSIESIGEMLVISRSSLGNIGDDTTVLVSYRFMTEGPSERSQSNESYNFSINIKRLNLGYSIGRSNTDIEGMASFLNRQSRFQSIHASFSMDRSVAKISLTERTMPTDVFKRQEIDYRIRPLKVGDNQLQLATSAYRERFTNRERERTGYSVSTSWQRPVRRAGHLGISIGYNGYRSDVDGSDGWVVNADYSWRYGSWVGSLRLMRNEVTSDYLGTEFQRQQIRLNISRAFR